MELGKVPPHDIEAEQAVLGSMLTDKDAVIAAMETLKPESFYREDDKLVYEAMQNLFSKAEPIDIITLKNELQSMNKLEQVGGIEYLANLPEKSPTSANVQKYINIVEEKSSLRRLIKTANELIDLGYSDDADVEDIMDSAERKIFDIMQDKNQKGYAQIKDVLVESFTKLEELYNRKQHVTGVPTGFIDLDYKTAGLHGSELILVAARPAMGKTAFALNLATNAALRGKTPVAIFSLEMSKDQLVNRILCSEAMVDSNKVRTGKLEDDDWAKLASAIGPLSESEIVIDDTPGITVNEIRTKCRKLKIEKNIGLIIIDYLQLITGNSKRGGSREQEIAEISRSLKILAKELDVPVIALSQLSRAVEQRTDHRPMLSDLRESGSIEQDADIVIFLYRDEVYDKESSKKGIAEIIIAKQRGGSTGTVELLWMGNYTKFLNLETMREEYE
ncbi:MAG: replicative DNA helicase [Clostridia bacterium]|nr:replicative DNA helicase [Clostridia bacterium]